MRPFQSKPDDAHNRVQRAHRPEDESHNRACSPSTGRGATPSVVSSAFADEADPNEGVQPVDKFEDAVGRNHDDGIHRDPPSDAVLHPLGTQLLRLCESIERLTSAVATHNELTPVLASLSDRCRQLTERSYEREYLQPIFSALIDIVARRSDLAERMKALAELPAIANQPEISLHLRMLADVNTADRVDIENLIARFGVEAYQAESARFDPETQQSSGSIETNDSSRHGSIAERVCPGYRRNGDIVRRERVRVYRSLTQRA